MRRVKNSLPIGFLKQVIDRLPRGTMSIGAGLLVNGLTAYAFITVSSRGLGAEAYSPVALLWALSFLLGVGFFLPLEQETARLVASRISQGSGVGPIIKSAGGLGLMMAAVLLVTSLFAGRWFIEEFFGGETLLFVGLLLVVFGLGIAHLVKGVLAGFGRFSGYARYVIGEGVGRLLLVAVLLVFTSQSAGVYGLAIGFAPFIGIMFAVVKQKEVFTQGPEAHMGDLSRALGSLLVASVATALVLNVSPLAVQILANDQQIDESGKFLNALLVARVPLFFFQAIQAALLPRLSGLIGQDKFEDMWRELRRLLIVVLGIGFFAVGLLTVVGPELVKAAFGSEFGVSRLDMFLLACSSAGLMIVLSLAQALIACGAQSQMALSWVLGVVMFPVTLSLVNKGLFFRVEISLVVTVAVSAFSMFGVLKSRLGREGIRLGIR